MGNILGGGGFHNGKETTQMVTILGVSTHTQTTTLHDGTHGHGHENYMMKSHPGRELERKKERTEGGKGGGEEKEG